MPEGILDEFSGVVNGFPLAWPMRGLVHRKGCETRQHGSGGQGPWRRMSCTIVLLPESGASTTAGP